MAATTHHWQPIRVSLRVIAVVALVGLQIAVGAVAADDPLLALGASAVIVAALFALMSPLAVAAFAFPAVIAVQRIGGGGFNLSYADAILVVSTLVALPYVPWRSRVLHSVLSVLGLYLVILAVTIVANPSNRAVIELFHRAELVGGAVIVGSAVAARGKTAWALQLFIAACTALALAAIVYSITRDFAPAYPFGVHKNASGFFMTAASVMLLVAPRHVRLPPALLVPIQVVLVLGLAACQSRASAATFLVILLLATVRQGGKRRAWVPLLGAAALVAMIWSTSQNLTDDSPESQFNSLNTRVDVYDRAMQLWSDSPFVGVGVRFWRDPDLIVVSEPHNLIISALGESGVVGMVGLVAFNAAVLATLRRRNDTLSLLAFYLVLAHFIDSMAGIYWVAGTGTLPWLVVGLAAGQPWEGDPVPPASRPGRSERRVVPAPYAEIGQLNGSVDRR